MERPVGQATLIDTLGILLPGAVLFKNIMEGRWIISYGKSFTGRHIDDGGHDFNNFLQFQPLRFNLVLYSI